MFGKKKKVSTVANKDELTELDTSVSELSKQTSELLKGFGTKVQETSDETVKEDTLKTSPRSRTTPARGHGKSFDIIQNPKTRTSLKATLKSAPLRTVKQDEDPELLPEHATNSYNEVTSEETQSPIQDVAPAEASTLGVPSVIGHRAGSLKLTSEVSSADTDVNAEPEVVEEVAEEQETDETVTSDVTEANQGITFDDEPSLETDTPEETQLPAVESSIETNDDAETVVKPEEDDQEKEEFSGTSEETKDDGEKSEEAKSDPSSQDSGELYANNLVHDSKPKSYTPLESQQKPTVFDTNEYHVELHDWSKLDTGRSPKGYILVLLIVIAAAMAYFILTGQSLPFVGTL